MIPTALLSKCLVEVIHNKETLRATAQTAVSWRGHLFDMLTPMLLLCSVKRDSTLFCSLSCSVQRFARRKFVSGFIIIYGIYFVQSVVHLQTFDSELQFQRNFDTTIGLGLPVSRRELTSIVFLEVEPCSDRQHVTLVSVSGPDHTGQSCCFHKCQVRFLTPSGHAPLIPFAFTESDIQVALSLVTRLLPLTC